ncbi:hypothetical protein VDG1235_3755 [Verrucomicrobiia bacterium DG1235]|nr:hypothetical protein VDG1235_3755 [Verrucomicrobiae bacterium DG1235]
MTERNSRYLIVDDSESHLELIKFGFKKAGVVDNLNFASDGEEALRFLRAEGEYADRELPDVVLLDLNMPKLSGLEVLDQVKNDEDLKHIPVLILSTSAASRDRKEAYEKRANSYLIKPYELKTLCDMMGDIVKYWGNWNLPAHLAEAS